MLETSFEPYRDSYIQFAFSDTVLTPVTVKLTSVDIEDSNVDVFGDTAILPVGLNTIAAQHGRALKRCAATQSCRLQDEY